jgi:hypothetical protein
MKTVVLNEGTHTYFVDGVEIPHFHQIVGGVGVKTEKGWRSLSGEEFMTSDVACENGTEFHSAAAHILCGNEIEYDPAMEPLIAGFKYYLSTKEHYKTVSIDGVGPLIDRPLYSPALNLAFTPDWVVWDTRFKNRIIVVDWKSTMIYSQTYSWQVAGAYKLGVESIFPGIKVLPEVVLFPMSRLKRPRIVTFSREEILAAENDFRSIYNVWKLAA